MINTIRLFRSKEDDLSAEFVLEFLKLAGFLVSDYVVRDHEALKDSWFLNVYDANIIFGISHYLNNQNEINTKFNKLREEACCDDKLFLLIEDYPKDANADWALLEKIVNALWKSEEEREQMCFLAQKYKAHKMYYYLYGKGNLKYIEEYCPIWHPTNSDHESHNWRQSLFKDVQDVFRNFYLELLEPNFEQESIHYSFAKLCIEYDLNDILTQTNSGRMFSTDSMIERVNLIKRKEPSMIRIYYLAGNICCLDNLYLANADSYYMTAIKKIKSINAADDLLGFLFYQLGDYYEKKYQNMELAEEAYRLAFNYNENMMRAYYKMAVNALKEGDYYTTITKTNDIICFLLNGYDLEEAMPGQQLYAYKSFVLMGDAYYGKGDCDLAEKSYIRALQVAGTTSKFYKEDDQSNKLFGIIQKMCMPVQPVYFKLINCVSKSRNIEKAAHYYEELRKFNRKEAAMASEFK